MISPIQPISPVKEIMEAVISVAQRIVINLIRAVFMPRLNASASLTERALSFQDISISGIMPIIREGSKAFMSLVVTDVRDPIIQNVIAGSLVS